MKHLAFISINFWIYLGLLVLAIVFGFLRWKKLNSADRAIFILMVATFVQEMTAKLIVILGVKQNTFTYNIFSPVEFFLLSVYFNESVHFFKRRGLGFIVGIFGILFNILYVIYIQPISTLGNYYLFFEGFVVIILCFFSFYQMLKEEEFQPYVSAGFWLTVCLMLYWCTTFAGWGLWNIMVKKNYTSTLGKVIQTTRQVSNYLFYSGVVLVFLNYPKLKPSGE